MGARIHEFFSVSWARKRQSYKVWSGNRLRNVFFEEFFCIFFGDFPDAFIFVDANHRRLFAHPLTFHFFDGNPIFKAGFLNEIFETIFNLAIVFTAFFSVAKQNHFLLFVFLPHCWSIIPHKCISLFFFGLNKRVKISKKKLTTEIMVCCYIYGAKKLCSTKKQFFLFYCSCKSFWWKCFRYFQIGSSTFTATDFMFGLPNSPGSF